MFSGLRENSLLYILDKTGDKPKLYEGTVVKEVNPAGYMPQFGMPKAEISVEVKVGESTHTFEKLPVNLNIVNTNGMVVSDSREAMLTEVQAMDRMSKSVLDTVPYHTAVTEACEEMYGVLNPQIAKERENEREIGDIKERLGNMEGALYNMQSMLSEALGKGGTSKN